jgi:hypothetical protein
MNDPVVFLESLLAAKDACDMFFALVAQVEAEIARLGVFQ